MRENETSNQVDEMREYKIVKSNDIIQKARFGLTAQEQKVLLFIISRIKPTDESFTERSFQIIEFCRICGIDSNSGKNYKDIKNLLKSLRDKSVWVNTGNGTEVTMAWLSKVTINKNSGLINIKLDDDMKPYLLQLRKRFTQYDFIYTLAMRSQYSIRLYELLKSYEWTNSHEFDVEALKQLLYAETYKNFKDFRRKVLEIAMREIALYSDLNAYYEVVKEGKKINKLIFYISCKIDHNDRLQTFDRINSVIDKNKPSLHQKFGV